MVMPLAWLALIVAAPAAAFGVPTSGLIYALGSLICHQRPDRSFDLFGAQMPVCARCAGIYAGAAIGAVLMIVVGWRREPSARRWRMALLAAAVPTAASWLIEVVGMTAPSNLARSAAALPLGATVAWVIIDAARQPGRASMARVTLT